MPLLGFKVLTFDVVGTLIDFEGGMIAYVRQISGRSSTQLADDVILESYRRSRGAHAPEATTASSRWSRWISCTACATSTRSVRTTRSRTR